MFRRFLLALFLFSLISSAETANAGTILSPTAVFNNNLGAFFGASTVNKMIDQSGLSTGFVSGVTDFATYTSTNPTHLSNTLDAWFSALPDPGSFDLDLGDDFTVNQLALWNIGESFGTNINEFSVTTSLLSDFSISSLVGTFSASSAGNPAPLQVFDLVDSLARFVRISIISDATGPGADVVGISELAFEVNSSGTSVIPVPAALPLFGTGLAVMGFIGWRKRRKVA